MRHTPPTCTILLMTLLLAGCGPGGDGERVVARTSEPPTDSPKAADGGVLVDVAGLVRRPGVYRLAAGARVHEAIAAAGGVRPGAALGSLNRAAPLVDGQQVLVAAAAPMAPGAGSGAAPSGAGVSINAGDAAALDALPGIGPVTAQRIVAEREAGGPYASIDDLDRVPGIGPATIETLRGAATT